MRPFLHMVTWWQGQARHGNLRSGYDPAASCKASSFAISLSNDHGLITRERLQHNFNRPSHPGFLWAQTACVCYLSSRLVAKCRKIGCDDITISVLKISKRNIKSKSIFTHGTSKFPYILCHVENPKSAGLKHRPPPCAL